MFGKRMEINQLNIRRRTVMKTMNTIRTAGWIVMALALLAAMILLYCHLFGENGVLTIKESELLELQMTVDSLTHQNAMLRDDVETCLTFKQMKEEALRECERNQSPGKIDTVFLPCEGGKHWSHDLKEINWVQIRNDTMIGRVVYVMKFVPCVNTKAEYNTIKPEYTWGYVKHQFE